jgi:DNA-binding IscR family transcriptional regulator
MTEEIDAALVATLTQLWRAHQETPAHPWSLAKLSKQASVPMSTLRRQLSGLEDGGLVVTLINDDGTGNATLTKEGETLCLAIFGE